jgi:hypothetical protein
MKCHFCEDEWWYFVPYHFLTKHHPFFPCYLQCQKISSSLCDVQFIPSQRHKMFYLLQMVDKFTLLVSMPEMSVTWQQTYFACSFWNMYDPPLIGKLHKMQYQPSTTPRSGLDLYTQNRYKLWKTVWKNAMKFLLVTTVPSKCSWKTAWKTQRNSSVMQQCLQNVHKKTAWKTSKIPPYYKSATKMFMKNCVKNQLNSSVLPYCHQNVPCIKVTTDKKALFFIVVAHIRISSGVASSCGGGGSGAQRASNCNGRRLQKL